MTDPQPPSGEQAFREEESSLVRITFGPLIWATHFVASYAAAAVLCAKLPRAQDAIEVLRWGILGGTVLALGGIAWLGWRSWRQWREGNDEWDDADGSNEDRHQFLGHAAFLLTVISFVGVVYTALPAIFSATCR